MLEFEAHLTCDLCGPVYKVWRRPAQAEGVFTNLLTNMENAAVPADLPKEQRQHCPKCGDTLKRTD